MKYTVPIIFFLVFVSFALAVLVSNVTTFSNGLATENLTFTGDENITRFIDVPRYGNVNNMTIELKNFLSTIIAEYCYQEDHNSTVCGNALLNEYTGEGVTENPYNLVDGNYSTFANSNPSAHHYINYSIPPAHINASINENSTLWQILGNDATIYNLTVPSFCIHENISKVIFRVTHNTGSSTQWSCANNLLEFIYLKTVFGGGSAAYEEAVFWLLNEGYTNLSIDVFIGGTLSSQAEIQYNNSLNISLNYTLINNILNDGCSCSNCSISGVNCRIPITFHSNTTGTLEYSNINLSYEYGIDNCTDLNNTIINFTYRDQLDGGLIGVDNSYYLNLYSPWTQTITGNVKNQNGYRFCSVVNYTTFNYSISGEFTLSKTDYGTQVYEYTTTTPLIGRVPSVAYTQYLSRLNETSTIVFTWRTNTFEYVDGQMEIYSCQGNGTKNLVGTSAIINGEAYANLELLNTPYAYEVIYNGVRYTDEETYSKCHIETQETRLYILEVGTPTAPITGIYSIPCNITRDGNFSFSMTWGTNPESDATITGCVRAYRQSVRGTTEVYEECSTTSGISATVADSGYTYIVKGRIYQNGYNIGCQNELTFETAAEQADTFGITGILAIFFLVAGMILLFVNENPKWYPIMGVAGIVVAWILGLLAFGWVGISSLVVFVIVIVIVGRYGKKE